MILWMILYHTQFTNIAISLCDPNKFTYWMHLGVYGRRRHMVWVSETSESPFVCLQPNKVLSHLKATSGQCKGLQCVRRDVHWIVQKWRDCISLILSPRFHSLLADNLIYLILVVRCCYTVPLYTGLCIINMMILYKHVDNHMMRPFTKKLPKLL